MIVDAVVSLFCSIVDADFLVRRINITACGVVDEEKAKEVIIPQQLDLFTDYEALRHNRLEENKVLAKERRMQEAVLKIKKSFGKNTILKGLDFDEGATARERNMQIGGHHE